MNFHTLLSMWTWFTNKPKFHFVFAKSTFYHQHKRVFIISNIIILLTSFRKLTDTLQIQAKRETQIVSNYVNCK